MNIQQLLRQQMQNLEFMMTINEQLVVLIVMIELVALIEFLVNQDITYS